MKIGIKYSYKIASCMFGIKIIVYHITIFECRSETNMVNVIPLQKVPSQIRAPIFPLITIIQIKEMNIKHRIIFLIKLRSCSSAYIFCIQNEEETLIS